MWQAKVQTLSDLHLLPTDQLQTETFSSHLTQYTLAKDSFLAPLQETLLPHTEF